LSGTAIAYQDGNYVGLYTLNYTARGVGYATFEGDDILGSTSGSGKRPKKFVVTGKMMIETV